MISIRRILVPIDFSKHAHIALDYGASLAEKFGAELHLLHVVQDLALFIPDVVSGVPPITPPIEEIVSASREGLDRIIREAKLPAITVRPEVREGAPFHEIIVYARDNQIDLIVMGTHGRSGLVHVLMGSVAEKVVRKAPCPVLTVRDPEHKFVHP